MSSTPARIWLPELVTMRFLTTLAEEKRCARTRGVLARMTCTMGKGRREGGKGRSMGPREGG